MYILEEVNEMKSKRGTSIATYDVFRSAIELSRLVNQGVCNTVKGYWSCELHLPMTT